MSDGITKEAAEKARRALRAFRSLQPTLNAYARMLTGRMDIVVEASATDNGSTDNKKIYFRPPIELGEQVSHRRHLCDKRDDKGLMRCTACRHRERILVTIYHEIAHIWFDSFRAVSKATKSLAIRDAVAERTDTYSAAIADRLRSVSHGLGYMQLAALISPYLPMLVNALEDARVNRALFQALPGTKAMFDANTENVFECGVEQLGKHGEWENELWKDRPPNMQAMIGIFCMASGYDFTNWLSPFVIRSLGDSQIVNLVHLLKDASSVDTSFTLSYPILVRLRELGFFRDKTDPKDDFKEPPPPPAPPAPEQEDQDDDKEEVLGEGDSTDSGDESGEENPGSGEDSQSSDDDSGDGDSSGSSDDSDGDPSGKGDEEVDDTDGASEPMAGSARPEVDGEDSDGDSQGGGDSDGDSSSGDGQAGAAKDGHEVHQEDSSSGETESESAADAGDTSGVSDGDRSGGDDLVGSDGEDPGESDNDEPGDRGVADSDPAHQADSHGGHAASDDTELTEDADDESAVGGGGQALDTGDYTHGTRFEDDRPSAPPEEWGDAADVEVVVAQLGDHESDNDGSGHQHGDGHWHTHSENDGDKDDEAIKLVIVQDMYFERPSVNVTSVNVFKEGDPTYYHQEYLSDEYKVRYGILPAPGESFDPEEAVVGPAVMRGRVVFADNFRARQEHNLRRGRVHAPSLARKAPFNDDRLFGQKRLPGRQDYFVGIGVDMSGSAIGKNIVLAKKLAFAEAELLSRLGIPFFLYAHTGGSDWDNETFSLDMYVIKDSSEPWNDVPKNRLRKLAARNANIDGHTFSFYRKLLEKEKATTKILHYYTDGAMPAQNFDEELAVLQQELILYKRAGIIVTGVGINTDSPKQHGLHTVEVTEQSHVIRVVEDLEKQLTRR